MTFPYDATVRVLEYAPGSGNTVAIIDVDGERVVSVPVGVLKQQEGVRAVDTSWIKPGVKAVVEIASEPDVTGLVGIRTPCHSYRDLVTTAALSPLPAPTDDARAKAARRVVEKAAALVDRHRRETPQWTLSVKEAIEVCEAIDALRALDAPPAKLDPVERLLQYARAYAGVCETDGRYDMAAHVHDAIAAVSLARGETPDGR